MNNNNPHPAHKKVLDLIPPEFHNRVTEALKDWDRGVQERFAEINSQYEEYKPFKNLIDSGVDATFAMQAIQLAQQVQADPTTVMEQINEAWNLGYISKDQAEELRQQSTDGLDDLDLGDGMDITKNPEFVALQKQLTQFTEQFNSSREEEERAASLAEFEQEMDSLEKSTTEKNLPFNRVFVTALMTQGYTADDAVSEYHKTLASQGLKIEATETNTTDEEPPVVMGQGGSTGSGLPDGTVDLGAMSKNQTNDLVEQMLQRAAESGQG